MSETRTCGLCASKLFLIGNTSRGTVSSITACLHCDSVCSKRLSCKLCGAANTKKYPLD